MEGEWRTGARGNLRSCRKATAKEMSQLAPESLRQALLSCSFYRKVR